MNDDERAIEIELLRKQLATLTGRGTALVEEAVALGARLPEIRAEFGNPFSYSNPEHADESSARFTGYSSHAVVLPTILALRRIDRELREVRSHLINLARE